MGEDYKNIDDLFKTELGQTVHKAPAQAKVNIDKALGLRNKRYLYLWLLLPLGIGVFFLLNSGSKYSTTGLKKQLADSHQRFNLQESDSTADYQGIAQNNENITAELEYNNIQTSEQNDINKNNRPTFNTIQSSNPVNHSSQLTLKNEQSNKSQKTTSLKLILSDANLPEIADKDSSDNTLITNLPNPSNSKKTVADSSTSVSNQPNLIDSSSISSNNRTTSDSITDQKNTPLLDSTLTEEIDTAQTNPDVTINPPQEERAPWLLTFNSGIDSKWSKMPTFTSNDSTSYDHIINDKIGHQGSIDISYRLKNSLTFGTGIGYSTLLENYTYYQSQMTFDTTYSWNVYLDSIPDSTGWIYFQDSTLEQSVSSNEVELYNANGRNKRTYLHIPVQIGTSILFDKIRWDLYAQGRFNLLLKSSITYVENDQIVIVPKGGFKQSYFDLVIGTGIHYNIIGNLYLSGSVKYRPPISKEYYPAITNRFQNIQVGVGFSLGF